MPEVFLGRTPDLRLPQFSHPDMLSRVAPEVRSDPEQGTFDGWACRADVWDSYDTSFAPGCWAAGSDLTQRFPSLWMHDVWVPIGVFDAVDKGDEGLWIDGGYDDTPDGQAARVRAKTGSAPGLSVGFIPREHEVSTNDDGEEKIRFTACELLEVSQITRGFQAVPGAELSDARFRVKIHSEIEARNRRRRQALARAELAGLRLRMIAGRSPDIPPGPESGSRQPAAERK